MEQLKKRVYCLMKRKLDAGHSTTIMEKEKAPAYIMMA